MAYGVDNLPHYAGFVDSPPTSRLTAARLMAKKYHPATREQKKGGPRAALFTDWMLSDQRTPALRSAAGVKSRADAL